MASVPPRSPSCLVRRTAKPRNLRGFALVGPGEFVANADHVRNAWRPAFTADARVGYEYPRSSRLILTCFPVTGWNNSNMEFSMAKSDANSGPSSTSDDRRDFLARCGRFAIVTPPAVAFLLSTSLTSDAIAQSGGQGNNGFGNGGGDGSPNGKQDTTR